MHLSRVRVRGLRGAADGDLEINLPGRFAVLAGANSAGKTTLADGIYLGHSARFPQLPRQPADALGAGDRDIEVQYRFAAVGDAEGPLGLQLQALSGHVAPGTVAAWWAKTLHRDMGRISTRLLSAPSDVEPQTLLVHLPAWRNPLDELARRETRILVELLRAQQQNRGRGRDLSGLRGRASSLLEALATDELLVGLEEPVGEQLRALSAGVSRNWPYPYRALAGLRAALRLQAALRDRLDWNTLTVTGPHVTRDARGREWFTYRAKVDTAEHAHPDEAHPDEAPRADPLQET
jgi:putative ATP-dependent endonuclease of OLD family